MKRWKVVRLSDPNEMTIGRDISAVHRCSPSKGFWGYLSAYQIQSVCGISWEEIPDDVTGENMLGYRFIYLRDPHITIDDFDIEVIDA